MSITFITAFWDIRSRENNSYNPPSYYLNKARKLCDMDIPLIIFTEDPYINVFIEMRNKYKNKTLVINLPFEETKEMKNIKKWQENWAVNRAVNVNEEKDTLLFMLAMHAKIHCMEVVLQNNVFKTDHLGWIDMGIHKVAPFVTKYKNWRFDEDIIEYVKNVKLTGVRVHMINNPIFKKNIELFESHKVLMSIIAGGFFFGRTQDLKYFIKKYNEELQTMLSKNFCGNDESIMARLVYLYPEMFDFSYGDYATLLQNQSKIRGDRDRIYYVMHDSLVAQDHNVVQNMGKLLIDDAQEWIKYTDKYLENLFTSLDKIKDQKLISLCIEYQNFHKLINSPVNYYFNRIYSIYYPECQKNMIRYVYCTSDVAQKLNINPELCSDNSQMFNEEQNGHVLFFSKKDDILIDQHNWEEKIHHFLKTFLIGTCCYLAILCKNLLVNILVIHQKILIFITLHVWFMKNL